LFTSTTLAIGRKVAAPAIGEHEPGSEAVPDFHVLAAVGDDGAVGLADGDGIAADFHSHVAGSLDADGFQAKVLVSGIAELAKQALNGLGAISRFLMRSHERAVFGVESGSLVVVAGVEGGDEVLGNVAE